MVWMNSLRRGRALLVLAMVAVVPAPASAATYKASLGDIPLAQWQPLPPASDLVISPEVQAARDLILGPDSTDPDFVKLWWVGVSSFVASMGGHLFFFDAWEIVGLHADYLPLGREELAQLAPEVIFIGHGHFDHAGDAGYVAGRAGSVVVGSEEICATAREQAARDGNQDRFACLVTGTADSPLPGVVQPVKLWSDLPEVQVLQHIHSAPTQELADPGVPYIHTPDLLPFLFNLNTDPQEIQWFLLSLDDPQGGTWAYHLRVGDFSLLWHDSTGPINDGNPGAAEVQQALNSFPDCVDVQVGAIVGFNQPLNGLRDPRLYVQHAHPRVALPTHHDAWAPVVGGGADSYETKWREEIASLEHPPQLDYLRDPQDYLKPRVYRVDDAIWKQPMPGSSCAGTPSPSAATLKQAAGGRFGGALGWLLLIPLLLAGLLSGLRRSPARVWAIAQGLAFFTEGMEVDGDRNASQISNRCQRNQVGIHRATGAGCDHRPP